MSTGQTPKIPSGAGQDTEPPLVSWRGARARPGGSTGGANHRGKGSIVIFQLPKRGHLGTAAAQAVQAAGAGRAAPAAQSSKGTCSAEYIITLLSSSCLPGGGGGAEKGERVSMAGEQGCFGGGGPACGFTGAPVSQETQAPVRQQGNGYRQDPSSPIPAALGPPAPVSNSPQHLKRDRNPPAKPSMLHWYPPSPRLQERHLRMLRKDPPAVKKAQRPVQRVMMKIGTRLASYQGFRNVWGDGENHVRNVTTCQPPP